MNAAALQVRARVAFGSGPDAFTLDVDLPLPGAGITALFGFPGRRVFAGLLLLPLAMPA